MNGQQLFIKKKGMATDFNNFTEIKQEKTISADARNSKQYFI